MLLTYKYRIKDANCSKRLDQMARSVNQVWNYCGQITNDSKRLNKFWPSKFDLIKLTNGSGSELGLHSDTVQAVCQQFVTSRNKARKRPAWRVSSGSKKSLGWIPFAASRAIKVKDDSIIFMKKTYRVWLSRSIPSDIRSGSFSQDSQGRWYINLVVQIKTDPLKLEGTEIGIDLGLKDIVVTSDGQSVQAPKFLRKKQAEISLAQKRGRKKLVRKLHRKVKNQRKHFLHVLSYQIIKENQLVYVGNVNSAQLGKTRMAKSVYDVGWSMLRSMFCYKAIRHGTHYREVDERWSTQTCSTCRLRGISPELRDVFSERARSGPKGLQGLGVRDWICDGCKSVHNRDQNAAINILISGQNIDLQCTKIPVL